MSSRNDLKKQKEKTSQALIDAALQICAEQGYASLSLRSVARKAGIAPTSFYRHFREIDEMGVEMVAQARSLLDECLTEARKKMAFPAIKQSEAPANWIKSIECLSRPLADTFISFMGKHSQLLHLFFQEQTGSSAAMRTAIFEATSHLTDLLADDLTRLCKTSLKVADVRLLAEAMLTIVSADGMAMLARPDVKPGAIAGRTIRKLNLLLLGAMIYE